jgi:hypothetical protein
VPLIKIKPNYTGRERRKAKASWVAITLAAAAVAAIAFATLCPIGMRPHLGPPDQERFGAYFVLGLILSQAAPRRSWLVLTGVVLLALGLEAAQLIVPTRDGRFSDACVKATGGVLGAQTGFLRWAIGRWLKRVTARPGPGPGEPARVRVRARRR